METLTLLLRALSLLISNLALLFGPNLLGRVSIKLPPRGLLWPTHIVCRNSHSAITMLSLNTASHAEVVVYTQSPQVFPWGADLIFNREGSPLIYGADQNHNSGCIQGNLRISSAGKSVKNIQRRFSGCVKSMINALSDRRRLVGPCVNVDCWFRPQVAGLSA